MMKLSTPIVLCSFALVSVPACSQPRANNADAGATQSNFNAEINLSRRDLSRGLDPAAMQTALSRARTLPRLNALLIARDGQTLVEHSFAGAGLDTPINIKSASKSVMSALAGIAIGRGVLTGVEQKIAPLFTDELPTNGDSRLGDIAVEDLLTMRAGLGRTSGQNYGAWVASSNWVRYALSRPFADDPGGDMLYSTGTSHLLSAALTKASGRSTHTLAAEWLGRPLDISIPQWPRDPQGIYFGGNDMLMSPRALLRFGELYRQDGVIDGQRILPAGWVQDSWRVQTASPYNGYGYGYGWFGKKARGYDVRFAWGYGGQMLFVIPQLGLTVVMISDPSPHARAESHVPDLHKLLDDAIIPAAVRGSPATP